jgi:hypothetical protein
VKAPAKGEDLQLWFQKVREQNNLIPDVVFETASPFVSQTFHKSGDRDIFFIVNSSRDKAVTLKANFRTNGRAPWEWSAETGTRRLLPWDDAPDALTIHLEPGESRLIVFENAEAESPTPDPVPSDANPQVLVGSWQLDLQHMNGFHRESTIDQLGDLGKIDGLSSFGGQAIYRLKFNLSEESKFAFLDLGTVREISEVTLNGKPLGVRWYGRHLYPLDEALSRTENELEVRVTTVSGNYAKSLTTNEPAQRWTRNLSSRPMGLLGPVRLLREK